MKFEHPTFVQAMEQIRQVGKRLGKPGGLHIIEPIESDLVQSIQDGYTFIAYSLYIRILDSGCRNALERVSGVLN